MITKENEQSIFDLPEMKEEEKKIEPVKTKKIKQVIGTVVADQLRVREEPDIDADVLLIIKKDDAVAIDEAGSTGTFYKVIVNGTIGYCMKEFIMIK